MPVHGIAVHLLGAPEFSGPRRDSGHCESWNGRGRPKDEVESSNIDGVRAGPGQALASTYSLATNQNVMPIFAK
ncbi:hypothetical protein GGE48_005714 [Rhizobium leguminosarum]|nr:hypothetical protein [Rhizobium leguminosarum]